MNRRFVTVSACPTAATGFQRIVVTANSHAGQTCKISLSGQMAPL